MKKTLLILFGGASTEHDVSCVSASFVISNINKEKYNTVKIGITKDGKWYEYRGETEKIANGSWKEDTENLFPAVISPCTVQHGILVKNGKDADFTSKYIDIAFPVLHGKNGEDGTMQGLLTLAGIPFVGCDTYSSAVTMDKVATKIICERDGIVTAPFVFLRRGDDIDEYAKRAEHEFGYPIFVKPACSGSSVGITKANNYEELIKGINLAFKHDRKVLLEKSIAGKEIEVAVIGNTVAEASVCGEIAPNADFYDYDTKYITDSAKAYIPARLPKNVSEKIRSAALKVYKALDCSGLSRVDFFCDGENTVFNEINTIPGFTSISMYPKLMNYGGRAYADLFDELFALAEERNAK